ncbi:MAG: energy-coupling factor transporter transmembrane protein EcfT [Bacillales bacterium]|nr:energy-coupling factor transporter transmembrane protein EcfT [Bacillales bacterium]
MMEKMIFGRYVPGDSIIHRLDPRSKLVFVIAFVCIVFLANNMATYGILAAFTLFLIFLSRIPFRFLFAGLKPILWLILFTFLLQLFFTREGPVVFQLGWIKFYQVGIQQGIFISLRFLILVLVTSLLTLTTTPISITDGLESLLGPFKKFKLPVHELALMISIALRFIPTLMDETEKIMKAQTARGTDFSGGPLKERIRAVIPLLIPLFVSSFKRAEDLAVAMEARGYKGGEGRTKYRLLTWKLRDTFVLVVIVLFAVALWLLRS